MRVYGRTYNEFGAPTWQVVETEPNGLNDYVYVVALAQCLKLNLGESPFFANSGIPAIQSVYLQIAPDAYVAIVQQQYAQFFASLVIRRVRPAPNVPPTTPTYAVRIIRHNGLVLEFTVTGIPQ